MPQPTVLLAGSYPDQDMAALEQRFTLLKLWETEDKSAYLARHAGDIRALATRGDLGADASLIAALPRLEIVACYGVGVDAIDLKATRARGIAVTNTPDVLTGDVADMALGLMLCAARQLPQADRFVRSGAWGTSSYPLTARMFGKRLGIVGLGRIGQAIARRAEAFEMEIAYWSRAPKADVPYRYVDNVPGLAAESDFLVATLAGGPDTAAMIGAEAFEALGPEGIFINVARGSVVDEPALIAALEAGRIRGVGLDVVLNEPDIDPRLIALQNTVLQPHQGSATVETRRAMGELVVANLAAHFNGEPLPTPVG